MGKTVEKIRRVLNSNILLHGLYCVPTKGATSRDIQITEKGFPFELSPEYKNFLQHWNGMNLDVVKLYGCVNTEDDIPLIAFFKPYDLIIIASDPAGFSYGQNKKGEIFSIDSDGGEIQKIASSFTDFITEYLFGDRAVEFGGEEWVQELESAHII